MKSMRKSASPPYVIVGNSVAGIAAIEAIREIDRQGPIVIIDREERDVYSRPLISYYLEGRVDENGMRFRTAGFYRRMGVRPMLGVEVRKIDARRRRVILAGNRRLTYRKLLLAVGAGAVRPPIEGMAGAGVHTFTSWDDAVALRKNIRRGSRAVVIGAGLIGIKAAEALKALGASVTVVEMADRPLPAILDRQGGRIVAAHVRKSGVKLILAQRVREIRRKGAAVTSVILEGGEEIPCRHLVIAVGVRPRLELCRGSGIKVRTGILVDRSMATSVEGIYAAGDVTEAATLAGGKRNIPLWPLAYQQGRVAGAHMAGGKRVYRGGTQMNAIEVFGLPLIALGESAVEGEEGGIIISRDRRGDSYRKILLQRNRISGALFIEEIERAGIIAGLMLDRTDVGSFREDLLSENFGYIYVPQQNRAKYIAPIEV